MNSLKRRRRTPLLLAAIGLLLPALASVAVIPAGAFAAAVKLDYQAGKLSADVSDAPVRQVMEELARKSGITVHLDRSLKPKRISARFENLGLEEGIKKLAAPYSSAMIFAREKTPDGRSLFFVREAKIFDSSQKAVDFEVVGKHTAGRKSGGSLGKAAGRQAVEVPPAVKDTAGAAAMHQKASASLLRSRISQKMSAIRRLDQKMRHQEAQTRRRIQALQQQLASASESESRRIQSQLSMLNAELKSSQAKDAAELKALQRQRDQMKNEQLEYSAALNSTPGASSRN